MGKRYVVRLTDQERQELKQLVSVGKADATKIKHANILLAIDQGGPAWTNEQAAAAFHCHRNTVSNIRQRFVEDGLHAALSRKKRDQSPRHSLCNSEVEAQIIALYGGDPPSGHARWTLRLLADKLVELRIVPSISHETVRQVLKKAR